MIGLLGDIHGEAGILRAVAKKTAEQGGAALIQVGDFGMFPQNEAQFRRALEGIEIPVYFIDGNHDDCTRWCQITEVTRVLDDLNLFYIPRGTILKIDGRTIAFMGGAASIDKGYRLRNNWHWDAKEDISYDEFERLMDRIHDWEEQGNPDVDLFITHCPPGSAIDEHFDPRNKLNFGVGLDWTDPNQRTIEELWHRLGTPYIYSGHMHGSVITDEYRILDVNEFIMI